MLFLQKDYFKCKYQVQFFFPIASGYTRTFHCAANCKSLLKRSQKFHMAVLLLPWQQPKLQFFSVSRKINSFIFFFVQKNFNLVIFLKEEEFLHDSWKVLKYNLDQKKKKVSMSQVFFTTTLAPFWYRVISIVFSDD